MQRYCENCGGRLSPGAKFCESCGAPIGNPEGSRDTPAAASKVIRCDEASWESSLSSLAREKRPREIGIVYTRERALLAMAGMGADDFRVLLAEFQAGTMDAGILYVYLDASDNVVSNVDSGDIDEHLELIRQVYGRMRRLGIPPRYLFLLGGGDIVPQWTVPNHTGDGDIDIDGDLAYARLSTANPWEGQSGELPGSLLVGRLPLPSCAARDLASGRDGTFDEGKMAETARTILTGYLRNRLVAQRTGWASFLPAGVAAEVWQGASEAVFSSLGGRSLLLSPDADIKNLEAAWDGRANVLYFNVHGSDKCPEWYGQARDESASPRYPAVFSPELSGIVASPNVLGVEACYGADLRQATSRLDSILFASLAGGCVAFLGSSRIAFGPSEAPPGQADIVVREFLKGMTEGRSAGEAFMDARLGLLRSGDLDDCTVKTIVEFSLYGDPALTIPSGTAGADARSGGRGSRVPMPAIGVPMVDIRSAVRMELVRVDRTIADIINSKVRGKYVSFASAEPRFYRMGPRKYQAIYEAGDARLPQTLKVYFDPSGGILAEYLSK